MQNIRADPFFKDLGKRTKRQRFAKVLEQAALDEMTVGATMLRTPANDEEWKLFHQFAVQHTSRNELFTTLKPLPDELVVFRLPAKSRRKQSK